MFKYILVKEVVQPICIIVGTFILYTFISKVIKDLFNRKIPNADERKRKTIQSLVLNIIKYLLIIVAFMLILEVYGIDTKSIMTSLGVVGIVVGLSLQDTLKDFISGLFIIFENQYGVGDIVTINNFKGEVISLGMKTTKIKSYTGDVEIISNRNIDFVINHSLESSLALVDVSVSYDSDLDKVEEVLQNLCERLSKELSNLTGKAEVLGITELGNSAINYRISVPTKPMKHIVTERIIRKEAKKEFDKNNIEIPFTQVVIHHG